MRLIIHAVNIHQGGGKTLLISLLENIHQPAVVLLDSRLGPLPQLGNEITIFKVYPNIFSRFKAELILKKISKSDDLILCFGNLPPLFKIAGQVFVYLQNRYLSSSVSLREFAWRIRIRISIERAWFKLFLRSAVVLVQSETMKSNLKLYLGYESLVMPFMPSIPNTGLKEARKCEFDYLYIASGEPHKNHITLLKAWIILAKNGIRPSLRLTLDKKKDSALIASFEKEIKEHALLISIQEIDHKDVGNLYKLSEALIYPSKFESFGLPLLEAHGYGLTIIASERDYVRDVVVPTTTFDPDSSLSIARAVMRHSNLELKIKSPDSPKSFLEKLPTISAHANFNC